TQSQPGPDLPATSLWHHGERHGQVKGAASLSIKRPTILIVSVIFLVNQHASLPGLAACCTRSKPRTPPTRCWSGQTEHWDMSMSPPPRQMLMRASRSSELQDRLKLLPANSQHPGSIRIFENIELPAKIPLASPLPMPMMCNWSQVKAIMYLFIVAS